MTHTNAAGAAKIAGFVEAAISFRTSAWPSTFDSRAGREPARRPLTHVRAFQLRQPLEQLGVHLVDLFSCRCPILSSAFRLTWYSMSLRVRSRATWRFRAEQHEHREDDRLQRHAHGQKAVGEGIPSAQDRVRQGPVFSDDRDARTPRSG